MLWIVHVANVKLFVKSNSYLKKQINLQLSLQKELF